MLLLLFPFLYYALLFVLQIYCKWRNLTADLGFTPAEQKYTLSNLLLAAIDYLEDMDIHLKRAVLHTEAGPDLIPANRRLADAVAGFR